MPSCFEVYLDNKGEYGFRLKTWNGQVLLNGVTHFEDKADLLDEIQTVLTCLNKASGFVVQVAPRGSYYYELSEPQTGKLLAKCGTFESKDEACESIDKVCEVAKEAQIIECAH